MIPKQWKFVLAGFAAGVIFVASCGQSVKAVAEAVLQALDVSFDNSGTGLSATDVQGAIEELDTRTSTPATGSGTWLVKDKNGVVIYETPRPDKCGTNHPWFVSSDIQAMDARVGYNASLDKCMSWTNQSVLRMRYASADCSGTPYVDVSSGYNWDSGSAAAIDGYVWFNDGNSATGFEVATFTGSAVSGFSYSASKLGASDSCNAAAGTLTSARPISVSNIAVPFEFPLTQLPTWVRN